MSQGIVQEGRAFRARLAAKKGKPGPKPGRKLSRLQLAAIRKNVKLAQAARWARHKKNGG